MSAGIFDDISVREYHHGDHGYWSHSKLWKFASRNPRYFYEVHVAKTLALEETNELRLGSAFESLYQDGEEAFFQGHRVIDGDGRGGAVKAARKACTAAGLRWVTPVELEMLRGMALALSEHAAGKAMISGGQKQITLRGELAGLPFQARPDWLVLDHFLCRSVDLKTTRDVKALGKDWGIKKYGYHTQAALVRELLRQNGYPHAVCYNWAVEKEPVHEYALYELDPYLLDSALAWLTSAAARLKECLETGQWPRGPQDPVVVGARWSDHPADNDTTDDDDESADYDAAE